MRRASSPGSASSGRLIAGNNSFESVIVVASYTVPEAEHFGRAEAEDSTRTHLPDPALLGERRTADRRDCRRDEPMRPREGGDACQRGPGTRLRSRGGSTKDVRGHDLHDLSPARPTFCCVDFVAGHETNRRVRYVRHRQGVVREVHRRRDEIASAECRCAITADMSGALATARGATLL